jgi:cell wall assembly regulator SMI1
MDEITAKTQVILHYLAELERPVGSRLLPGVTASEIAETERALGLRLPTEVVSLWRTCGGTRTTGDAVLDDIHFFPGYYLLSPSDAVSHVAHLRQREDWRQDWIPLFANGGGDFYFAQGASGETEDTAIRLFQAGLGEPEIGFASLARMLDSFAKSFEVGIFFVDPKGGYLEQDDDRFWRLVDEIRAGV